MDETTTTIAAPGMRDPLVMLALRAGVPLEEYMASLLGPGIHHDVTMEEYLALPYMSASRLEILRRSAKQLRHAIAQPPKPSTDALDRGTALHLAVLEPVLFEGHYITIGACEGRLKTGNRAGQLCGNQGSVWRDGHSYCGTHDPEKPEPMDPEIHVLKEGEYGRVLGMRDAILAHPRAASLFEGRGQFETTVVFDDPETGVRCKMRPDRLIDRAGMNVDIKTTRDAADSFFPRNAENLGYFRKLNLYRRGLRAVGWPYQTTAVLAIESDAPHDLIPYLVEEDDLDTCDRDVSRLLWIYRTCVDEDRWPGYTDEFKPLFRPQWAKDADAAA